MRVEVSLLSILDRVGVYFAVRLRRGIRRIIMRPQLVFLVVVAAVFLNGFVDCEFDK